MNGPTRTRRFPSELMAIRQSSSNDGAERWKARRGASRSTQQLDGAPDVRRVQLPVAQREADLRAVVVVGIEARRERGGGLGVEPEAWPGEIAEHRDEARSVLGRCQPVELRSAGLSPARQR